MSAQPRTVLVVEDDPKIAALVVDYLKANGFAAEHLDNGAEVVPRVKASPPAAIVLDLMLPGLDGMEVCKALRRFSSVPILILTARVDEIDRLLGLELGADDYVCKPFSPRELVARVRAVLRRTAPGSGPGQAPQCDAPGLVLDDVHWRASLEGTPLNLTRREFGLLQVLSRHPGRIFSRARLLELAYDDTVDVTERAIDSHVKNLRRKLGAVSPAHDWIRSVYGVGFAWEAPPQA